MRCASLAIFLLAATSGIARAETAAFSADKAMSEFAALATKSGTPMSVQSNGCKDNKGQRGCNYTVAGAVAFNLISAQGGAFLAALIDGPKILDKDGAYLDATIQVFDPALPAEQRRKFVSESLARFRQTPPKGGPITATSAAFRFNMLIFNKQTVTLTIIPVDLSRIRKKQPGE